MSLILTNLRKTVWRYRLRRRVPAAARAAARRDRARQPEHDPGGERVVAEALAWLGRAQDQSRSQDGGAARHFSLIDGWSASYPETTGYIVPTLLACARRFGDDTLRQRARRMLDWLVSIQFPEGGFQGGVIGDTPVVPVTFNTGQILIGLAAGVGEFGDPYREPMRRAADWLAHTQDADGCWRRHPTPFAQPGEKTYETHVAWGLLEAARVEPRPDWTAAALRNVRWALGHQRDNGWFDRCCLEDERAPLTHTLGYALRGVLEAFRYTQDATLLRAGRRTADGLLTALHRDGFLPGRLGPDWRGRVRWACLTGTAQLAYCWLMLYQDTGADPYREAAFAANRYLRRTLAVDGLPGVRGGVRGSFPIDGDYGPYQYLNWACKFFIDSQLLEQTVRAGAAAS
jgi:hypothetical protein